MAPGGWKRVLQTENAVSMGKASGIQPTASETLLEHNWKWPPHNTFTCVFRYSNWGQVWILEVLRHQFITPKNYPHHHPILGTRHLGLREVN